MGVNAPAPGEPGDREYGDAECCLVGWNWLAACIATVVAPLDVCAAFVTIVRLLEGPVATFEVFGFELAAACE